MTKQGGRCSLRSHPTAWQSKALARSVVKATCLHISMLGRASVRHENSCLLLFAHLQVCCGAQTCNWKTSRGRRGRTPLLGFFDRASSLNAIRGCQSKYHS